MDGQKLRYIFLNESNESPYKITFVCAPGATGIVFIAIEQLTKALSATFPYAVIKAAATDVRCDAGNQGFTVMSDTLIIRLNYHSGITKKLLMHLSHNKDALAAH